MGMIVLNGLIADPFCGLRRNEAFKNLRDSLIIQLSKSSFASVAEKSKCFWRE